MLKFAEYLKGTGRSGRTVTAYVADVQRYARWCEAEYGQVFSVAMVNRSDLADYQNQCRRKDRVRAATWNRYMVSLSLYCGWLIAQGELSYNPAQALSRAEGQSLAPKSLAKPEYRRFRLAVNEAVRTASTPAARWQAVRNAALVTLLAEAGMREGEIVHLRPEDLVLGERKGRVLIVDGKGNKDRAIPLDYESVHALKAWMALRGDGGAAELFRGKRGDALQERGIQRIIEGIAEEAKIGHVSPHQLRHTFGYLAARDGVALDVIAALMGHASIEVTRRYTLPHWSDLESVVER